MWWVSFLNISWCLSISYGREVMYAGYTPRSPLSSASLQSSGCELQGGKAVSLCWILPLALCALGHSFGLVTTSLCCFFFFAQSLAWILHELPAWVGSLWTAPACQDIGPNYCREKLPLLFSSSAWENFKLPLGEWGMHTLLLMYTNIQNANRYT